MTANIYLEALYNGLPFILTPFFENILEFLGQTSIIAAVCLRFYRQSDVTLLKEFQQCLNSRYLTSTSFSLYLYTLGPGEHQCDYRPKYSALNVMHNVNICNFK